MTSEKTNIEPNTNDLSLSPKLSNEEQTIALNNKLRNDFMSYCLSILQDDEEARQCVQIVWNKYLQCVGDVAMVNQTKNLFLNI
jgi:hypothetical protein